MKNRGTVQPATHGQVREVLSTMIQAVPDLSAEETQYWIGNKRKLQSEIRKIFKPADLLSNVRAEHERFYREELGMEVDFSGVRVPDEPGGFDRVLIVAKGLTIERVIAACRRHFAVSTYRDNLSDADMKSNERTPAEGHYAIRVRNREEADEELKNLSAEDVLARSLKTETLLERLLHELKYFRETGKHLDADNWTLCSGSRISYGCVPRVGWNRWDRGLCVYWANRSHRHGDLRPRAVSV